MNQARPHGDKRSERVRAAEEEPPKSNPGFGYLVGEVEAIQQAREREMVSLLEAERRESREERLNDSLERLNRYRKSQGLKELGDLDELDDDTSRSPAENSDADNILRGEASRILADIIALSRDERLLTQSEEAMK